MIFKGLELICPHCRGDLAQASEKGIRCRACNRSFRITLGIPDLRVAADPYIGVEEEYAKVERLAERFDDLDFPAYLEFYYSITDVVRPELARAYIRSLLAAGPRTRDWLASWEQVARREAPGRALLEVGCGTAPLLVAAEKYPTRVGVDIALRWLVIGKKRLTDAGLDIPLICACAEALPFGPARFDTVVADSTIEHLADQPRGLAEMHSVMQPGARIFLSTPNRYCPGPDPQTKMWGGTYLPEKWMAAIVLRQGGRIPKRHLLTGGELHSLLAGAGFRDIEIYLPGVPADQRAHFSGAMRAAMAVYDTVRRVPLLRSVMKLVGPLFHAVARRS